MTPGFGFVASQSSRNARPRRRLIGLALFAAIALFSACGGSDSAQDYTQASSSPATSGQSDGALSDAAVCSQFWSITAELSYTDQQSAQAFHNLAVVTQNPALAVAIQTVSDGFSRHDQIIPSTTVAALCK